MPEMHLRQRRFVYSTCGPFTRHKERIKEFKRTGDMRYIYRNELDKACFQHDSAYGDHKDLINRAEADKVLRDKAYDIASNPKYDGYQRGLAGMVYKFFDKKSMGSGIARDSFLILADEPIIRKFNKRKVYLQFKDNIWGVDLADMQSLSRKNKGIKYLLCAIDLYSKYAFVIPLKDKKGISDQWTTSESEKTGLYGKIYDFVVDYEHVAETTKILDMHRYLITKHSIIS